MRRAFSVASLITPNAVLRKANGSFEPVGFSSIAQKPNQHIELVGKRELQSR